MISDVSSLDEAIARVDENLQRIREIYPEHAPVVAAYRDSLITLRDILNNQETPA